MHRFKRGTWLIFVVAMLAGARAVAQVPTTTIADTVYYANGTPAQGTITISWNAFTTANGAAIAAGNTTVTLGSGGSLTIALAPNVGSTPMGNFYTAVYRLNDGETSKEFWVIPVVIPGGGPAKLAGIRNQVLPTSVAMQAVTKQYVDAEILAAEIAPLPLSSAPYVLKAGDTMTGPLLLPGDPASALQAADKNYVDNSIGAISTVHATGGTVDGVVVGATTPASGTFTALADTALSSANAVPKNSGAGALSESLLTDSGSALSYNSTAFSVTTGGLVSALDPNSPWQYIANGGATQGAGIDLVNSITGSSRRNWAIFTEAYISGDMTISHSAVAGGTPNTSSMEFFSNGDIGVGTTTDAGYLLNVNGSLRANTLATAIYTVAGLPAAGSLSAGTQVMVSDAGSYTPGSCTGGGSDYMIAITNGSSWSCH